MGVVEEEGDVRAVPGGVAVVQGHVQIEQVAVGGRLRVLGLLPGEVLGGLPAHGVQGEQVGEVLLRVALPEEPGDLFGVAPELLRDHGHALLLGELVLMGHAGGKGELPEHAADDGGDGLGVVREAHLPGVAHVELVLQGAVAGVVALLGDLRGHGLICLRQLFILDGLQLLHLIRREAQMLEHGLDEGAAVLVRGGAQQAVEHAAHDDAFVEEAVRLGDLHQVEHLGPAAGLAEDGHVVRVAAEARDVLVDPLQSGHQICVARVGGVLVLLPVGGQVQVAQDVQPVVQGDHHHVAELGEGVAVIGHLLDGRARREAAPVEPDHDGFLGGGIDGGAPYVQILAVLVLGPVAVGHHHLALGGLPVQHGADVAVREGVLHALPGRGRRGGLEALGVRVLDAVEGIGAVPEEAPELSGLGLDDGGGGGADELFCHSQSFLSGNIFHLQLFYYKLEG